MEEMLGVCQRPEVGGVGAKLIYPDNTIQHAGCVIGMGGIAGHMFVDMPADRTDTFTSISASGYECSYRSMPDDEERSINYDKLDALLDYHCNNGTDCIVICGTTGESATMTEEEHMQCVKFAIDRVKGRIPVIAGTGSNCTRTAIDMSKEAADYGADGLLLVTPYYNKATQAGLIAHYEAVAKEAKAPIIMYSVASRTGCNIEPATVAELVKNVDNIVGVKEASGNTSQVAKIMSLTDGNIDLYSGMMIKSYHYFLWEQRE